MRPIDRLLEKLDGVREMGPNRWMAKCSAHPDKTPSLSIKLDGEIVLIYCHAGCYSDDVIAAVGLTWSDLYSNRDKAACRAALSTAGRRLDRLPKADPMEHEKVILKIARAWLRGGKELSLEDQARIELARARLGLEVAA